VGRYWTGVGALGGRIEVNFEGWGSFWVVLNVLVLIDAGPASEGSDSVVEKETLRSMREVSKVMLTELGCVMVYEGIQNKYGTMELLNRSASSVRESNCG